MRTGSSERRHSGAFLRRSSVVFLTCTCAALALGGAAGSVGSRRAATSASPTFAAARNYKTGDSPAAIAVADLNGDGKADLVTADFGPSTVSVVLGRGDGSFLPRVGYPTGNWPRSVAIGDLNGDGKPDLATANWGGSTVSVLLNRGDGTFRAQQRYPTGRQARSIALGDLNGDGAADLVTADARAGTVSVLLNRGDGSFLPKVAYPAAKTPVSVAVGELNDDGKPDIVTGDWDANTVSILLNRGDGTFLPRISYRTGDRTPGWKAASNVAIGDLNGDRRPDLAVVSFGNGVSALINRGDGHFEARPAYIGYIIRPLAVAIGDVNGDGIPDLALAGERGATVAVGRGDGTWRSQLTLYHRVGIHSHAQADALADLNADGRLDLVTATDYDSVASVLINAPGLCNVQPVSAYVNAMKLEQARRTLALANCRIGRIRRLCSNLVGSRGYVLSQNPPFGTVLPGGGKVELVVSRGPRP